jgi:phage gpG-like protein
MKADTSEVDNKLDSMLDALTKKGMRELQVTAERQLRTNTGQGFRSGQDPSTGKPWPPRKGNPGHHALDNTGKLRRSIGADSQLYGKRKTRMLLRSTVEDRRSGNRSYHAIAGAQFFGRRDQRQRMIGRGQSRGKGGPMPPRRFTGVSRRGRKRIAAKMQSMLRRG